MDSHIWAPASAQDWPSSAAAPAAIGRLAASAMEGIARQPQSAATIQTAMLIAAALIEGIAFLALVICFLMSLK